MSAPHMRLKSAFRQRSSPSEFIAARALLRIAAPVETSSLDDLRATVKEARATHHQARALSFQHFAQTN